MTLFPWFLVTLIDRVASIFGFATFVRARSGAWGAERIFFIRAAPGTKRVQRLKPCGRGWLAF